jgi:asparagine synthetase B (glutamine-hydrolysing)
LKFCGSILYIAEPKVNMEHKFNLPDSLEDRARLNHRERTQYARMVAGGFVPLSQYFSHKSGYAKAYQKNYSSDMNRYYLAYIIQMMEKNVFNAACGHSRPRDGFAALRRAVWYQVLLQWEDAVINLCQKYDVALEISGLWHAPGRT